MPGTALAYHRKPMRRSEAGQATVEWSALLLAMAILLGGIAYAAVRADAWNLGDKLLHGVTCALGGGCGGEGDAVAAAYGADTAELVRRYSPNVAYEARSAELPIDFRRCRTLECSNGSANPSEIRHSSAGLPVTAFTRVVDRRAAGGALYLQYWFYYPESFSAGIGRIFGHSWPGYHRDDWEGYQVRVTPDGKVSARATSHGSYSSPWTGLTGWYRVSGGSHAGQVAGPSSGERTTPGAGLALAPLERLAGLAAQQFAITPPWLKDVYRDPESGES
jgi:hypothetical protein